MDISQEVSRTAVQTVLRNIAACRMNGVSTKTFIEFKWQRELNEKQIHEKNQEPRTSIVPVSNVAMKLHIIKAKERIWSLHRDNLIALRNNWFGTIPEPMPHIAIKHILQRPKPPYLKARMVDIITWRRNDNLDKRDFKGFMGQVIKRARKLRQERGISLYVLTSSISLNEEPTRARNKTHGSIKKGKHNSKKLRCEEGKVTNPTSQNQWTTKREKLEDIVPPFQNQTRQKHDGKHFIQQLPELFGGRRDKIVWRV